MTASSASTARTGVAAGAVALLLAAGVLAWILGAHGSRQPPGAAREGAVVEAAAVPPPCNAGSAARRQAPDREATLARYRAGRARYRSVPDRR